MDLAVGIGNEIIQATCNALGGYLVQIESAAEQEFVWNIKKSSKKCWTQLLSSTIYIFFRICRLALDWRHRLWSGRLLDVVPVQGAGADLPELGSSPLAT